MWSPDSREIAFLQGGPDSLIYFSLQRLAVISDAGGTVRVVSRSLDRSFVHPAWSADGKWIYAHWGETAVSTSWRPITLPIRRDSAWAGGAMAASSRTT